MPRSEKPVEERLTGKQRKFVEYYVGESNGNATDAARRAGYAVPAEQGYENLRKPHIRAAIDERLAPLALSAAEVLSRLSEHARADVGDFDDLLVMERDEMGELCLRIDLKGAQRTGKSRLIKKLKPTRYGVSIELHDAQGALDKLARYHGLYRDNLQVAEKPFDTLIIEHGDGDAATPSQDQGGGPEAQ